MPVCMEWVVQSFFLPRGLRHRPDHVFLVAALMALNRIILMRLWNTEKGHNRIANEFLNKSLVFAYYLGRFRQRSDL